MIEISREDAQVVVRAFSFLADEGLIRDDEYDVRARLIEALAPVVPQPPRDPRTEEDEYMPNHLNLSEDL